MHLRFWGVRGTFPLTSRDRSQIGYNTSCLSLTDLRPKKKRSVPENESILIFDAGTGLNELSKHLMKNSSSMPQTMHMFFSHYHHDHLMGLTAFKPFFNRESTICFYGPSYQNKGVKEILSYYFAKPLFPFDFLELPAASNFKFHNLKSGMICQVDDFKIKTCSLNHPQGALAFRCTLDDRSLVYATDHEEDHVSDELIQFIEGADVLIMDSNYLHQDWTQSFRGWGHSSCQNIGQLAARAKVKKLFLFHYELNTNDSIIQNQFLAEASQFFSHTFLSKEHESVLI